MKRKWLILLSFCTLFIFTACGQTPEETTFSIFENAVKTEEGIEEFNQRLIELEGVESTLFNEIISGGKVSNIEVQEKLDNALQNCKDRKDILDNESNIMKKSYEKSTEAKKKIEKLDDKKSKEQGEKVLKLFNDRYYSYTEYEKNYQKTIATEEELYSLLIAEQQNLRDVEDCIARINSLYKANRNKQSTFNDLSSQLNTEKNIFYQSIGIQINEEVSDTL